MRNPSDPTQDTNPQTSQEGQESWKAFGVLVLALSAAFFIPLRDLTLYGLGNALYSHAWLMPIVCVYLGWQDRERLSFAGPPKRVLALVPVLLGGLALLAFWQYRLEWTHDLYENYLSSVLFAYVMSLYAAAFLVLGSETLRTLRFPFLLLLCTIPFPVFAKEVIQAFFQHTSAELSYWMIKLVGTPIYREGLVFKLSSISLEVAPQCSGIRSSLVLFITSLIAGHWFLKTAWKRVALVLFVIPLAIVRNAVRIFTIAELCDRISPDMIHSWVHHQGGPFFFALSLGPFLLVLYCLRRSEAKEDLKKGASRQRMDTA